MKSKTIINSILFLLLGYSITACNIELPDISDELVNSSEETRIINGQISTKNLYSSTASEKGYIEHNFVMRGTFELRTNNIYECNFIEEITVKASPEQGNVITEKTTTDGKFTLNLKPDKKYIISFYQNEKLCGEMVNSKNRYVTIVGIGKQDHDFGEIHPNLNGEFIPEFNCEDKYDSDSDGTVDQNDEDFTFNNSSLNDLNSKDDQDNTLDDESYSDSGESYDDYSGDDSESYDDYSGDDFESYDDYSEDDSESYDDY